MKAFRDRGLKTPDVCLMTYSVPLRLSVAATGPCITLPHAYAHRLDAADRSIVLSGDTAVSRELIAFARRADVLLHEVMHLGGVDRLVAPNAGRRAPARASVGHPHGPRRRSARSRRLQHRA
jgi:ribonuclease BN (tRNA processing enzyme)